MFCLFLFSSLYCMEKELLLKKEDRPVYKKIQKNAMYQAKIPLVHCVVTSLVKGVPEENKVEIQSKIFIYTKQLYGQDKKVVKIGVPKIKREQNWLYEEELRRKTMQCSERLPAIRRGAGWGGCFGCIFGGNGAGLYYLGDGCVRCCCIKGFSFLANSVMNQIMCYSVSICACAGCAIGACCVATGLSKDIDVYFA